MQPLRIWNDIFVSYSIDNSSSFNLQFHWRLVKSCRDFELPCLFHLISWPTTKTLSTLNFQQKQETNHFVTDSTVFRNCSANRSFEQWRNEIKTFCFTKLIINFYIRCDTYILVVTTLMIFQPSLWMTETNWRIFVPSYQLIHWTAMHMILNTWIVLVWWDSLPIPVFTSHYSAARKHHRKITYIVIVVKISSNCKCTSSGRDKNCHYR